MFRTILLIVDGSSVPPQTLSFLNRFVEHDSCLTAVYIMDSGWRQILGDEWISSHKTRSHFFRYVEKNQQEQARLVLETVVQEAGAMKLQVRTSIKTGHPHQAILSAYHEFGPFDLLILPHPARKFTEDAVKINGEKVAKSLACPILIM